MNIYRIYQTENVGYDTYDSAVVVAENEEEARMMNPAYKGTDTDIWPLFMSNWEDEYSGWASSPENVSVEKIGIAVPGLRKGPIVSSFNAG
jgi:hypothetical protein